MPCSYLGLLKAQNQEEQVLEEEHRAPQRISAVAWTLATKGHIHYVAPGISYFILISIVWRSSFDALTS